jgi:hypothetical protein
LAGILTAVLRGVFKEFYFLKKKMAKESKILNIRTLKSIRIFEESSLNTFFFKKNEYSL